MRLKFLAVFAFVTCACSNQANSEASSLLNNTDSSDYITMTTIYSTKATTSWHFEITTASKHTLDDSVLVKISFGYASPTLKDDYLSENRTELLTVNHTENGKSLTIDDVIQDGHVLFTKENMMNDPEYKIDCTINDDYQLENVTYHAMSEFEIPKILFEKQSGLLCFSFSDLANFDGIEYDLTSSSCKFLKLSYEINDNVVEFNQA